MTPKLIGDWSGASVEEVFAAFRDCRPRTVPEPYEADSEILLACLSSACYEESAVVIYRSRATGTLYCSESGHCSCNGFEGQFEGTETTLDALRMMHAKGWRGGVWGHEAEFNAALGDLITELSGNVSAGEGI